MPATTAEKPLVLQFTGTFTVEAQVDPVAFYAALESPHRTAYLRWDGEAAEEWPDPCPAWMKPYAYLVCSFIVNSSADAGFGAGWVDNTDELDDIEDRVRSRAGQRSRTREETAWCEDDYWTLLRNVPWLLAADDSEQAAEIARTAPGPDDQPFFGAEEGSR